MAQFSALEQMQNLNQTFSYSMGFSMMGKYISAEVKDEATGEVKLVNGRVDMVRVVNGKVHAVVGEDDVPVDKITQVSDTSTGSSGKVTDFSSIIGMLGKTNLFNKDGKASTVEGIISSITKKDDGVYANLDEVEIKPHNLDIGAFENEEEYVKGMIGKEVTMKFKDGDSGEVFEVTGVLRAGFEGTDGELRLVLDNIKVPASNIYSTKRIDLLSTEQMLLNEILKELQKQNSGDDTETPGEDAETKPVDETETSTGT
jgi:flagellar basal-body rod modification protein FlgD